MTESKKHYREIGDGMMAVLGVSKIYGKGHPSIYIEISMGDKCHPLYGSLCVSLADYYRNPFNENMDAMLNLLHSDIILPGLLERFIHDDLEKIKELGTDSVWSFGQHFYEISMVEAKHAR